MNVHRFILILALSGFSQFQPGCQKKTVGGGTPADPLPSLSTDVEYWITKPDQSALLQKQAAVLRFSTGTNSNPEIIVDSTQAYQSIDGFGYTLTGGSADLINSLSAPVKSGLLRELFSRDNDGIGIDYLRISMGASDLNASVFSYDDMPAGQTDPNLTQFSLGPDLINLVPLLKEILLINPGIRILASPWSAPSWMKTNNNSVGGSLLPQYYQAYANYFVRYLQAMQLLGIPVDAITVQNEPMHGGNNPSMLMTAAEQAAFVANNLGPTFQAASIQTKIIIWDHNCDNPAYPLEVLSNPTARNYINGSAFHLYGGDITALSQVHLAYPDKQVYFTEQYTSSTGDFAGDLKWHIKNVIIGSMRNWSRNALEWNLANDPLYGPHTPGGCTVCKGALTINGSGFTRNVSYYIIAHASRFVPRNSVRIKTDPYGSLHSVAFLRPDGKKVLIVLNEGSANQAFNIKFNNKVVTTGLDGGAVATYTW